MPNFFYDAKSPQGFERRGSIEAKSREDAVRIANDMGLVDPNVRAFDGGVNAWGGERKAFNLKALMGLLFLLPALFLVFLERNPTAFGERIKLPEFPYNQHLVGLLALVAGLFALAGLVSSHRYRRGGILACFVFGTAVAMVTRHVITVPIP